MSAWRDLVPTLLMLAEPVARGMGRVLHKSIVIFGCTALLMAVLAFTRVPFDAHRWLGLAAGECLAPPEMIVVLGGSGMPSGPELLRLHRAAELAKEWPGAQVVVVHPGEMDVLDAMFHELVLRGVAAQRIDTINSGDNTREQALVLHQRYPKAGSIALVTSPENTYRSVLAFRKADLVRTCGAPAWDHAMHHDFRYRHGRIGGKAWIPDLSDHTDLRYNFWNYLKLEVTCLREGVAIAYYWANGWI